ncbi:gonadotropin-releasing hormone II receptor-like isoform X2 [Zootermopsis nevadensis]|uniref:gonadotropin-releasing hormone II receptor-like isoform X2 n=1 Tax=Zootermopsis nevadensis TaxID=136037 RepID=UPI000B8E33E9|nr:gonadotropin-releasing hormone II receptor-like isoform X2 [Zootermopsis nevadensis]XP_021933909.1 gonadotropin-releasing hormone II receptor-like isoform X2 [Zootermopsis nevadensis]
MMSAEGRADTAYSLPHSVKMNDSVSPTAHDSKYNISASAVSPIGSALILLQGTILEGHSSLNHKNKSGSSGGIELYVDSSGLLLNETGEGVEAHSLPGLSDNARSVIAVYCVLFTVAAIGNLSVFLTLLRARHRKSRVSLLMTHLAVADLIVTFVMIPLEVGWRVTTKWLAGNFACKLFLFLRTFGLYLSSNILVCISLDRYFAIIYPLKVSDARRRGKLMLLFAWFTSLLCSIPQSVVFHVSEHPENPTFYQCVTFGFFATPRQEMAYNLFCVVAMYFLPLLVISFAYSRILCVIVSRSSDTRGKQQDPGERTNGRMRLRRSDMSNIERARARTLRMTVTIVVAFVWCWTPYVVITLWYMFDRDSAQQVDSRLQDALFIMVVSNSCVNPLVYGSYTTNFRRECKLCFGRTFGDSRRCRSPVHSLPSWSAESSGKNS